MCDKLSTPTKEVAKSQYNQPLNLTKMRKLILFAIPFIMMNCTTKETNPLLSEWDTPFQTPPFSQITEEHYLPAIQQGIDEQKAEIDAIVNNSEAPTFENTLIALDKAGASLSRTTSVFFAQKSSHTNEKMQAIAKEISPLLSALSDDINLNPQLFARVKTVYEQKDKLGLNTEEMRFLEETYNGFVRGGANLPADKQERFREVNTALSLASLTFGDHLLAEQNEFELIINDEAELAGLPQSELDAAVHAAKQKGVEGKYLFTISRTSLYPFITYADNRDLREKLYRGYFMKGDNGNDKDNKDLIEKIVALRIERANMLGFDSHSAYTLDNKMAKNADNVYKLLNEVWAAAIPAAEAEVAEMQKIVNKEGGNFELQSWDWWYYAEKVRQEKYALSEEELKPYFKLENVRDGIFALAGKLWGITFTERNDIDVYHPDVNVFEVKEADGTHIGIFYTDYYVRPSKRSGAWMTSYRKQQRINGENITPIILNVCNFPAPTEDMPSLLSFEQVTTAFHEFGHALHGLFSDCEFNTLSGTSVARDFVELPSQIMENWAIQPDVLKMYAKHYKTGEVMPQELIDKVVKASQFNQGFATTEYVAASLLDMDWHTQTAPVNDVNGFEKESMDKAGLISEIVPRYRSTYFQHIFSGGYSSGYYSYMWAEVLDADAFNAFKENGIFDKATAKSLRDNIFSQGGTEDPMKLYVQFRGAEPNTTPLLERRGLK